MSGSMAQSINIRSVIFQDGDHWVAQCLEYDIGAQAADIPTLQARLRVALTAECEASLEAHGKPFAGIDPAPAYFHNLWNSCTSRLTPIDSLKNDKVHLDLALCA